MLIHHFRSCIRPKSFFQVRCFGVRPIKLHPETGVQMNKFHGQHILQEQHIVDRIIDAARVGQSDTVLEIGPGTGNLTLKLLEKARQVVAIEIDPRLVTEVIRRGAAAGYGAEALQVIDGNCLHVDWPRFDHCVANLPYNVTTPFLFKLLGHRYTWQSATLMVQEEVAFKLLADPGEQIFSRLSLNVRLYARVLRVCQVSAGCFFPQPQVSSQVIKLIPRQPPPKIDFEEWDGMIRICFAKKRRTLHAQFRRMSVINMLEHNYKTWCSINHVAPSTTPFKKMVCDILIEADMSFSRSRNIDIPQWMDLLNRFHRKGIHFVNVANEEGKDSAGRKSAQKKFWKAIEADDDGDDDGFGSFFNIHAKE